MKTKLFYLIIGMWSLLVISLYTAHAGAQEKTAEFIYTVKQGDNLIEICERFLEEPLKWTEVAQLNQVANPHLIQPGQHIRIPQYLLKLTPVVGRITFLKGNIWKKKINRQTSFRNGSDDWIAVDKTMPVHQGDVFKSEADSRMVVQYDDGAELTLWPESQVEIEKTASRRNVVSVKRFFIRAGRMVSRITRKLNRHSRFRIKTSTAVTGVRGTEFRVAADATETTRIEVMGGEVAVSGAVGDTVAVHPGEGTWVEKGKAPEPPIPLLPPPKLLNPKPVYTQLPVTLCFDTVPGAVSYRIKVSRDTKLNDVVWEKVGLPDAVFTPESLTDGTWYVSATSIDDKNLEGPDSDPVTIHVKQVFPGIITTDVIDTIDDRITVTVHPDPRARWYQVQVASDEGFQNLFMDNRYESPTIQLPKPQAPGWYYIRARMITSNNLKGPFTQVGSFQIHRRFKRPILIMIDVSGSMQQFMNAGNRPLTKVAAAKEIVVKLAERLPPTGVRTGVCQMVFIPGSSTNYQWIIPFEFRKRDELTNMLQKRFCTEFPVFNRCTSLNRMMDQLDKQVLGPINGQVSMVLLSDGKDNDSGISTNDDTQISDPGMGILSRLEQMKQKYGPKLKIHTVYLEKKNIPAPGAALLQRIATLTGGRFFEGDTLLDHSENIGQLADVLMSDLWKDEDNTD